MERYNAQRFRLNHHRQVILMKRKVYRSYAMGCELKKRIIGPRESSAGFTLVEMIVAMVVGLLVLAGLYNLFAAENKSFSVQETTVEMQQNARAAMDMMVTEIQMAGYDPAASASSGISSAAANSISFTQDLNGDGDLGDTHENITYAYDSANLRITRNTGSGNQPFAENIEALNYFYYDGAGITTATSGDIKKIKIEIRVRTAKKDPNYGTNNGFRTYTLTSDVTPRNLAYP